MPRLLFLSLIVISLLTSCDKKPEVLGAIKYKHRFYIPPGLNTIQTHYFEIKNIYSRLDIQLEANNTSIEKVGKIIAATASLEGHFDDMDFSSIRNISVRIYLNDPEDFQEIFYLEDIPQNDPVILQLIPALPDVKQILEKDIHHISVRINFWRIPNDMDIDLNLKFAVEE